MSLSQSPPDQDADLPFSVFLLCHGQDDLAGERLLIGEEGKEVVIGSVVQFGHQGVELEAGLGDNRKGAIA